MTRQNEQLAIHGGEPAKRTPFGQGPKHCLDEWRALKPIFERGQIHMTRGPEVMQLRFDPVRSPMNALPVSLRRPVLGVLINHADGAIERVRKSWRPIDVMNDPSMLEAFPFEVVRREARNGQERRLSELLGGQVASSSPLGDSPK